MANPPISGTSKRGAAVHEIPLRICSGDVRLRPWAWTDAPALVRNANSARVARYLGDAFPHPYAPSAAAGWLDRVVGRAPVTQLAIEIDSEAAGCVGLMMKTNEYRYTAELGYWLGERHWGQGVATEAARAAIEYGFSTFGLRRIESEVIAGNAASARVLEKAGMALEGVLKCAITKHGVTNDVLLYSVVR